MGLWYDPAFVAGICATALGLAYGFNHLFAPRSAAVALTLMLIMLWCAEWAIYFLPRPPDPTWLLAGLDLIGALGSWLCWRQARRGWKEVLTISFIAAIVVQIARSLEALANPAEFGPHTAGADTFTAMRNVLFFVQVSCCGWSGGSRAGAWICSYLPGHSPGRHRVGSGR